MPRQHARIKASVEEIAKSLQGKWWCVAFKQALAAFDFVSTQLVECD